MTRKPIGVTSPYRKIGCVQHDCERCQRGWVGLTKNEVEQTLLDHNMGALPHRIECIRAIEALLKEKNT